jgi:hypothetical protein
VLERSIALDAAEARLLSQKIELDKLRLEIARLKRMKYGRSPEQLDQELTQIQLTLEDLESTLAQQPESSDQHPRTRCSLCGRRYQSTCLEKRWCTRRPVPVPSAAEDCVRWART